ncbi:MAG: beta-galactosidase GalB [Armatimonadota bacterium]|jgi:beta-galactosidase
MSAPDGPRSVVPFDSDWRFTRSDPEGAAEPSLDDSSWEQVRVPHDWAITGPFDRDNDLQVTTIWEDGEKRPSEHTGRTGGLPIAGIGWYRKRFTPPDASEGKRFFVEFDGVMSHSTVYVNGHEIGSWPYGYSSFCFEITDHVRPDGESLLAVRVDNPPSASRWYPGAGIYRNVRLTVVHPVHVAHWGTYITYITGPDVVGDEATVTVRTELVNQGDGACEVELTTQIVDATERQVGVASSTHALSEAECVEHTIGVRDVRRWDVDDPQLHQAISTVAVNGEVVDRYVTPFGVREMRFDANDGFLLNGRHMKLKGVCLHHDLGPLGAAVSRRAIERQLEILKEMGCNAIRTSHNPPAPELLELCDSMGFVVIDEAFDEWKSGKCRNGYHTLFDEWAERDLTAMIHRDRNHPCVIMWSIGNEIGEQHTEGGAEVARYLTDICHREDPTRPVTAAFNQSDQAIENGLADVVDVPGWNYKCQMYRKYRAEQPEWIQYGSETESCVSSRGEYYFPVEEEKGVRRETLQVTSYDVADPGWGYPPDYEFRALEECPSMLGEFVWTGFDYLGEPTPYKEEWPSRSSYFGIIDLCGLPKDRYYLYQSHWSDREVLHVLPHWNWEGREGEVTPVHVYTSYDAAELFLNGQSLGVRKKDPAGLFERYRLIWDDVPYEPGELKVVAVDEAGQPAAERVVRTAGSPKRIELAPDRRELHADGKDLCFITVSITDGDGNVCPLADNVVRFELTGPAQIAAVGNGNAATTEPFVADRRKAFHGLCMLILRSEEGTGGQVRVKAISAGLRAAEATALCRR